MPITTIAVATDEGRLYCPAVDDEPDRSLFVLCPRSVGPLVLPRPVSPLSSLVRSNVAFVTTTCFCCCYYCSSRARALLLLLAIPLQALPAVGARRATSVVVLHSTALCAHNRDSRRRRRRHQHNIAEFQAADNSATVTLSAGGQ